MENSEVSGVINFRNRIAVVTGAASGIGLELMLELVRRGAHVAACDIDQKSLLAAVQRAAKIDSESRVTAHVCDVSNEKSVVKFAKEVVAQHGSKSIHLLFNNAGVVGGGSFVTGAREEWDRTFAVSWFGTYYCTRTFLPMLIAADQGAVINISSVNGIWASLGAGAPHTAYSSAKFAVKGFTEALLVDFRKHAPHLSAMLVLPGHVRTKMPAPPRSWRRALNSLFADYEPVSSKQVAERVLESLGAGQWRVVIGQDAEAIDSRIRGNPWTAYE